MKNLINKAREVFNRIHNRLAKFGLVSPTKEAQKQEYIDLLIMLFWLYQLFRKEGPQGVERHIEDPMRSEIFKAFPSVMKENGLIESLCDVMKVTLSADMSPENVRDELIEKEFDQPLSIKMKALSASLVTMQRGAPPLVCIEVARKHIPPKYRPTFEEVDHATKYLKRTEPSGKVTVIQVKPTYFTHKDIDAFAPMLNEIKELKSKMIKGEMTEFTINDFDLIDDRGIQTILKETPNFELLLAMKTLPLSIKLRFFKNTSDRASQMLQEDLSNMGPARLSDVESAQAYIVNVARRLESEGKLLVERRNNPDTLV